MEKPFTVPRCDRRGGKAVGQAGATRIKRYDHNGLWEGKDHRLGKKSMHEFHTTSNWERRHGILVISHRQEGLMGMPLLI